jgi:GT2 family glycosyltransferase
LPRTWVSEASPPAKKLFGWLQSAVVSVLIVNWNTRDLLRKCLQSIAEYAPAGTEVVVVDNASKDGSAAMVRTEFPHVKLSMPGQNTGYAKGNNIAFEVATGEWLLTLNPDTEFVDDTLARAVQKLEELPEHGCLACRLQGPNGETQASVRGFPTLQGILGDVLGLGRRKPGTAWDSYRLTAFDYEKEQDCAQPMGSFLLFRKEALASIGDAKHPFDESFPIFFNEVDLLYRLDQKGWKTRYVPSLWVLHHGGMGTRQVRKSMIWESHRSLIRYLRKHSTGTWNALGVSVLSALVTIAAFVRAKGYDAGFRP